MLKKPCLIRVCSATADRIEPKFAKFPVKFPVCREFCGRPVRSAMCRQPDDLTGLFWTKLCEKLSLERSFGNAEEGVQGGADRGASSKRRPTVSRSGRLAARLNVGSESSTRGGWHRPVALMYHQCMD